MGRAVSELALNGMRRPAISDPTTSGFPVLTGAIGHPVTDEVVAAHRDDQPEPDSRDGHAS